MSRRVVLALGSIAVASIGALALTGRTQQPTPLKPSGNVRDHGATGAGDDTEAIQNAVNAAALTGYVYFPKGSYRITKTVVIDLAKTGFIALRGDGVARVVMAGEGPAFKFVGTHAGTAAPNTVKDNVWSSERMPVVDGLEIVGDHENADAIEAAGTMQLTITRLLVRKCRHAIHLTGRNRNVSISNCHIYQNRGIGVFLDAVNLHQINVTGCHVSYCDGGASSAGPVKFKPQITGCDIESNQARSRLDRERPRRLTGGSCGSPSPATRSAQSQRHGSANITRLSERKIREPTNATARHHHRQRLSDVKVNVHLTRRVVVTGNTF